MIEHTSETIWIGKDAYMYLDREERRQRGCRTLTAEAENAMWERITTRRGTNAKDGMIRVNDDSFGGGDGTYNGKWWGWNIPTVKQMLDDAGFTYRTGEKITYTYL